MRSTFKVLFYVNGSKEKNGIVPIMGRVTINGSVAQFSCKQTIAKGLWDAERQPSERKEQGSAGHQSRPIQHQSSNHQTLSAPFGQGSVCYSRDGTQYLSVVRYGI